MWRDPWNDRNFGFGSRFFEDVEKEFAEAEEMLNRLFRTARETSTPAGKIEGPFFYGYQLTVGPDGKPHVREFGNVRPSERGLIERTEAREPMVDATFDEKENKLVITAEMPGVTRQDIKVNVSEEYVTIHAERGEKKYHAQIPVEKPLEKSAKTSYSNGILELKIKLKETQVVKAKGTEVRVE